MKKLMTLVTFLYTLTLMVQAAPPKVGGIARKPVKIRSVATGAPTARLPLYGGRRAVMGINYAIATHASKPPYVSLPTPTGTVELGKGSHPQKRSWMEHQVRNFRAWQLRLERRARDRALLERQNLERAKAALPPLLVTHAKRIEDQALLELLPEAHPIDLPTLSFLMDRKKIEEAVALDDRSIPALPFMEEPNVAYRGMALTPADIRNVLTEGLLRRATEASNRRNMALAGGSRGAIQYFASHPVINLTASPLHARFWGSKFLGSKPILTIVKISGDFGNSDIINVDRDIPTENIMEMITLLQINGRPTWCRTQLGDANSVSITPYLWRSSFEGK